MFQSSVKTPTSKSTTCPRRWLTIFGIVLTFVCSSALSTSSGAMTKSVVDETQSHSQASCDGEAAAIAKVKDCSVSVAEPNPPHWPDTVKIIHPHFSQEQIRAIVEPTQDPPQEWFNITKEDKKGGTGTNKVKRMGFNSDRHFSLERFAILFAPGTYHDIDVEVGYYVQVAGLGGRADDVIFQNGRGPFVEALNKHHLVGGRPGLSLDTFWRAAENFKIVSDSDDDGVNSSSNNSGNSNGVMLWAVSQAAPLRRVHIAGDLLLHDEGAQASGGHMANGIVEGRVDFGSQQQWLCRSVDFRQGIQDEHLGAWSNVFVDCKGTPKPRDGKNKQVVSDQEGEGGPSVTVDIPIVTVEKPFVALADSGKYKLHVPPPRKRSQGDGPLGPDLTGDNDDVRDFSHVRVVSATEQVDGKKVNDTDVAQKINKALEEGKDVVLAPGMYYLNETIQVSNDNQVILGLGLATLVAPLDGKPCIRVAPKLQGVRIAGIMLEASDIPRPDEREFVASFIEWGQDGQRNQGRDEDPGNPENPGLLSDIFARVGGSDLNRQVSTDVMIRIHSGNVVGDNLWLWRADHVQLAHGEEPNFPPLDYHQTVKGEVPVKTGIEVNGDNVTIHGLAVEHTTEHQTVWNGEHGNVQFYQSELPYDVDEEYGHRGFLGYHVHKDVQYHHVGGIGVYSNFRDHFVPVKTAIRHPKPEQVENAFTMHLNNQGQIMSVMNGQGGPPTSQIMRI